MQNAECKMQNFGANADCIASRRAIKQMVVLPLFEERGTTFLLSSCINWVLNAPVFLIYDIIYRVVESSRRASVVQACLQGHRLFVRSKYI